METIKIIEEKEAVDNLILLDNVGKNSNTFSESKFQDALKDFIINSQPNLHTVLGFDIYRYSHFEKEKQRLLPLLFFFLYNFVFELIHEENILFKDESLSSWNEKFISTGDGGYQIFPTPIHAINMLVEFHNALRLFNQGTLLPELNKFLGNIEIRYCLTFGEIFRINHSSYHNHYGEGIINCARIISLDKLNRFLIDENVHRWFLKNFGGIESLQIITWNRLSKLNEFSKYNYSSLNEEMINSNFINFRNKHQRNDQIIRTDVQRIGEIKIKESNFSIYSVYLKVLMDIDNTPNIISIGNQNSHGLV